MVIYHTDGERKKQKDRRDWKETEKELKNTEIRIHRIEEGRVAEGTNKKGPVTNKHHTRDRTEGNVSDCI